jgi:hypothetical protein
MVTEVVVRCRRWRRRKGKGKRGNLKKWTSKMLLYQGVA